MSMPDSLKYEAQFNRAFISSGDFAEAEEYLDVYHADLPDTFRRALLVSAIVAYARPFTLNNGGAEGLATSTLMGKPKQILGNEEFILHEKILRLRHEAVAHSDYDRRPTRFLERVKRGFLVRSLSFDVLSETIDIAIFLTMCTKMRNHCTDTLFRLSPNLGFEER
jgi:hypothetical protein